MQYLLTRDEYEQIFARHDKAINDLKDKLQNVCSLAAENVKVRLDEGMQPWGCVRTSDHTSYCDLCPVRKLCPYEGKRYSK